VSLGGYLSLPFAIPSFGMWSNMTDEQLKAKFDEIDADKSGKLNKEEITKALKELGKSDAEIAEEEKNMKDEISFEEFVLMARPPKKEEAQADAQESKIKSIPGIDSLQSALSGSIYTSMNDEDLKEAFTKIDSDKSGKLTKSELAAALKDMEKSEEAVKSALDPIADGTEFDFDQFKELVAKKGMFSAMYIPGANFIPTSIPMGMPSFGMFANMTDEELRAKFDELDGDKSGKLDKDEIRKALKDLGRSDEDIEAEISKMKKDEMDFDAFRLMAKPPKKASAAMGYVHSVPLFGSLTSAFGDSMFGNMTDAELQDAFNKMDDDKSGKLSKTELAEAMRNMGKSEKTIEGVLEPMADDEEIDFAAFKELVKPKSMMPGMPSQWGMPSMFGGNSAEKTDATATTEAAATTEAKPEESTK